jgi:hypothetical protein
MPKASKKTASESVALEGYEGHFEHFDGGYSVGFETYTADADLAPLFKGLPDDRCQCPHWGYVVRGKVAFTFADGHDEMYEAGDAYYAPPGHSPRLIRRLGGRRGPPHGGAREDDGGRREKHGGSRRLAGVVEGRLRRVTVPPWARHRPPRSENPSLSGSRAGSSPT